MKKNARAKGALIMTVVIHLSALTMAIRVRASPPPSSFLSFFLGAILALSYHF